MSARSFAKKALEKPVRAATDRGGTNVPANRFSPNQTKPQEMSPLLSPQEEGRFRGSSSDGGRREVGGWSFSRISVFSNAGTPHITIQKKLRVGETNDPLEDEADRAAERVMRMAEPEPDSRVAVSSAQPQVNRKCSSCQEEEEQLVRRKAAGAIAQESSVAPESVHNVLRGSGQPLSAPTRAFFEQRFGYNFGSVRVHKDALAAQSAREIGARAYTVGSNIVLAEGESSTSTEGRRMLAHELAHVVQQGGAGVNAGKHPPVFGTLQRVSRMVQRQSVGCRKLLRARGSSNILLGKAVEFAIRRDFTGKVGPPVKVTMPDASAAPSRTENPRKPHEIPPEIFSFFSGKGHPDLAFRRGGSPVMLLAEIKPANLFGLSFAETQLAKYIDKGNENEQLKQELGVRVFAPMTSLTYHLPSTINAGGKKVNLAWCGPGVILYKAVDEEEEKKKKKKKDKKEEEEEGKKKKKKKGKEEEEEEKKEGEKEGGNVGFGIGILSSGGGTRNATLGVAINSHGTTYGTASAGVVYDANGEAIASASAGVGAHVSGNAAGTVTAGAAKNTSADAALTATAGKGEDTSAESLANASAGTAKGTSSVAVATASHGHAEDQDSTQIAKAGKAGEQKPGGQPGGGQQGASGGIQIPGATQAQTDKVVKEAEEIDALLQKSSPAQKELLAYLAQTTGDMQYEVPSSGWVRTFLTATSGLSPEDIAFLEKQKWVPGEVSAEELKKRIDARLKNKDKPQGDVAGGKETGEKKPPDKQGAQTIPDAKDKGTSAQMTKPDDAKKKITAASLDDTPSDNKETEQEAYHRLAKRAKGFDWKGLSTGEIIFSAGSYIYDRPTSGAFYWSGVLNGKRTHVTADVGGIPTKEGDHDVFEIRSSSIVATDDGRAGPGSLLVGLRIALKR